MLFCLLFHQHLFTLFTALALMIPMGYLFVFVSGLLFGRPGLALSSGLSLLLCAWVLIALLLR